MNPYRSAPGEKATMLAPKRNWIRILALAEVATCTLFWTPIPLFVPILLLCVLAYTQLVLRASPERNARARARSEITADEIVRSYD